MRNRYLYITLLSLLGFSAEATAQVLAQTPQLVVNITINQLRTDLLETYAPLYSDEGLKRLLDQGMVFPDASYSFTPVDPASATASMQTGTTPYYNGVVGTEWMNRSTLRPQNIIDDKENGPSPTQLMTSTLSDELKIATKGQGKVFSFATTPECAILSAGHAADGAVWTTKGEWQLAPYYKPVNQWLNWYVNKLILADAAGPNLSTAFTMSSMETLQLAISSSVGSLPPATRRLTADMTASLQMAEMSAPVQFSVFSASSSRFTSSSSGLPLVWILKMESLDSLSGGAT